MEGFCKASHIRIYYDLYKITIESIELVFDVEQFEVSSDSTPDVQKVLFSSSMHPC